MTETKLLPCPFCGGEADTVGNLGHPHESWLVTCAACQIELYDFSSLDEAIAAWNRRAAAEHYDDDLMTVYLKGVSDGKREQAARVQRLEDALRFYADAETYAWPERLHEPSCIVELRPEVMRDKGKQARAALENKP